MPAVAGLFSVVLDVTNCKKPCPNMSKERGGRLSTSELLETLPGAWIEGGPALVFQCQPTEVSSAPGVIEG